MYPISNKLNKEKTNKSTAQRLTLFKKQLQKQNIRKAIDSLKFETLLKLRKVLLWNSHIATDETNEECFPGRSQRIERQRRAHSARGPQKRAK